MLLSLSQWLLAQHPDWGFLRVFQYLTFRAVMSAMTALLIGLGLGPWVIRRLTALKIGQPIRGYGMQSHLAKRGTPTMGGVLILLGIGVATLLWFDWSNRFVWVVMLVTFGFGAVGWADDWRKVVDKNPEGMRSRDFVMVGASNAVNVTDGLDGLAIMPVVLVGSALGIFAYIVGNSVYSRYLLFPYIPGAGELLIFCGALAGAGLAFLWFNAHPAQVFMGDVGALALGGALGTIAIITRQEIVLGIMGAVFVAEVLSVVLQVGWFKYTKKRYGEGRRILKMAPLHHHFEKSGWTETQVVIRFWIITMLLCLAGLATLKLR